MRYVLRAYVCDCGDVKRVNDEGSSTVADIFLRRPDTCKYAIVRFRDKYLVVDLYELLTDGKDVMIGEHIELPTEDAAIAAAQLKY